MKKSTIFFLFLDIIAGLGFYVMYGPWNYVRNLYVMTAMQTMNHQWLAKVFYNDSTITNIQNKNYFISIDEDVNLDDVVIQTTEKEHYKDKYERELLTRDENNDLYKVLNVKVGNANGYLIAIYEPKKVRLLRTKKFNAGGYGERVVDMCKRYGGLVCINGGGFANGLGTGSDIPSGYVIDDGKVVLPLQEGNIRGNIIGMTKDGKLKLMNHAILKKKQFKQVSIMD